MNPSDPDPGLPPRTKGSTPSLGYLEARSLKRELLAELRAGWDHGEPICPEHLLGRWPTNPGEDPDVASMLIEDFLKRRQRGEGPTAEEYRQRFPAHQESMTSLLQRQGVLHSFGLPGRGDPFLALPQSGDEVFGFDLDQELGHGAFARVFLARQRNLAGRPVVLKVSAVEGTEPQTLAQLQHTHIVPIYSLHDDPGAGVRAVCMPYFGGASLSRVLHHLRESGGPRLHGRQLVEALRAVSGPPVGGDEAKAEGVLPLFAGMRYDRCCLWIVARLAEALGHAHRRGICHRDIKPSNVLLAADGQPLLLDFNLAQNVRDGQAAAAATLGGTVAYMAPEHLRALAARDPALARLVDHRSDVYALGMVLFEMLVGHSPFDQSASYSPLPPLIEAMAVERGRAVPSLRAQRPDVSGGLENVVRKCLAPDPARRYQQAEHLAEDLNRLLDDRPLRYAPEGSWRERGARWLRRHPRLAVTGLATAAAAAFLTLGGAAVVHYRDVAARAEAEAQRAEEFKERSRAGHFEAAAAEALYYLQSTADPAQAPRRGERAARSALALYDLDPGAPFREPAGWAYLDEADRRRLRGDTRELLMLLALERQSRCPQGEAPPEEVGQLFNAARSVPGLPPWRSLEGAYAGYLTRGGPAPPGSRPADGRANVADARDQYLVAVASPGEGFDQAAAHLEGELRRDPRHYWSWLRLGLCRERLGDATQALVAFQACVVQRPDLAWSYFNRGRAYQDARRPAEALADYTTALERDPSCFPARLNRGLVHLELRHYRAALDDFDALRDRPDVVVHACRGAALENLGDPAEADKAFALAWPYDPDHAEMLVLYGLTVGGRRPEEARKALQKVLQGRPHHARAWYGLARLTLAEDPASDEGRVQLARAVAAEPSFTLARAHLALTLARRGEVDAAREQIQVCYQTDPDGPVWYAAACVYAVCAARCSAAADRSRYTADALKALAEAFRLGYGRDEAVRDDDLRALREDPEFLRLVQPPEKAKTST